MGATKDLGLDIVRVSAFDGRTLSMEESAEIISKRRGHGAMIGRADIGCFLSHRETWRQIAAGNDPWAFVAEDDVHLATSARRFLESYDWIPEGADIIKAETWLTPVRVTLWNNPRVSNHTLRVLHSTHFGAAGYFISSRCAANILQWTENAWGIADCILFDDRVEFFRRFKIYQIDPAICIQDFNVKSTRRVGFESVRIEANIKDGVQKRIIPDERKRSKLSHLFRIVARPFEHFWRHKAFLLKGQWVKTISFEN